MRLSELPPYGLVLPDGSDRTMEDLLTLAQRAEAAGAGSIWAWEGWGYDPFTLLGRVADRIDSPVGTAIANGYARSPAALAMGVASLDEVSDGRFVLGVGASTPQIVEGLHGNSFERPVRRLRELIEVLDLALSGERIGYDGAIFNLDGFRLTHTGPSEGVPVLNAALGRTNVAMSLEYADGVMPNLLPFEAIPEFLDQGAARADLDEFDSHVVPMVPICVHPDGEQARDALSRHVASYIGPVEFYRDVVSRYGYEETATAVHEAWMVDDRATAAHLVSDELLDAVGVAGTPESACETLRGLVAGQVDGILLSFPDDVDDEMINATLDAIPETT